MSVYLDASVLVSIAIGDQFRNRALGFVGNVGQTMLASDFAMAEVTSAIARLVRTGETLAQPARTGLADIREWAARVTERALIQSIDVAFADAALSRFNLTLRTADAIHIGAAQRLGATLVTFDRKQAESARKLRAAVIEP